MSHPCAFEEKLLERIWQTNRAGENLPYESVPLLGTRTPPRAPPFYGGRETLGAFLCVRLCIHARPLHSCASFAFMRVAVIQNT